MFEISKVSQIPQTKWGFELWTSYIQCSHHTSVGYATGLDVTNSPLKSSCGRRNLWLIRNSEAWRDSIQCSSTLTYLNDKNKNSIVISRHVPNITKERWYFWSREKCLIRDSPEFLYKEIKKYNILNLQNKQNRQLNICAFSVVFAVIDFVSLPSISIVTW